jgi:hypothetical protein
VRFSLRTVRVPRSRRPSPWKDEAIEAARDLLADGDRQGLDRREWIYEIDDETGATMLTLPFSRTVEPDLPEAEG